MGNTELFNEWMQYAEEDRQMAELALEGNGPVNQICFHSQQMAEKSLKGFLVLNKVRFERAHQLDYLLALCQKLDIEFAELTEDVKFLTDFYTETRYPGDVPEFTLAEGRRAYQGALTVKEFVSRKGNHARSSPASVI